jgi:hypothetical protein
VALVIEANGQVATQVPGEPMGDGRFFSLARENGGMAIVAAQSLHMIKERLGDSWESVFSNLATKLVMSVGDYETAEQASKLAGKAEWYSSSSTTSAGGQGMGSGREQALQENDLLPAYVLTRLLGIGQAAVIGQDGICVQDPAGAVDPATGAASAWLVQIPPPPKDG